MVAKEHAARLPQSETDERLHRNRMPACKLDLMLRRGASIEDVADQAALRLVERWARMLHRQAAVPFIQLAPTIASLVHEDVHIGEGELEMPTEPLYSALFRVVPDPESIQAGIQWQFLEELIATFKIEQQFDRNSCMHVPPPSRSQKLAVLCGGPPPVWVRGQPKSSFSICGLDKNLDHRYTTVNCDKDRQAWAFVPRPASVPGPGTYTGKGAAAMASPRRAEFSSVGRPRPACFVSSLSQKPRFKNPNLALLG